MAHQVSIVADILAERDRQDKQWGGPVHDDQHTLEEWAGIRSRFEFRANPWGSNPDIARVRDALVKLAAVCLAQVESIDRRAKDGENEAPTR
jgi:hypothetical protein